MNCWNAANCSQTTCVAKHSRPPPPKVSHAHNTRRSGNRGALPQPYQQKRDKKIKRVDKEYYCKQMDRSKEKGNKQKTNNQTNEQENHTKQPQPEEIDEFFDSFANPPQMTGINNTGNTCYQNAVLQCLRYNENIMQMIGLNAEEAGGNVTQEIDDICKTLKSGEATTITPYTLQSIIIIHPYDHPDKQGVQQKKQ